MSNEVTETLQNMRKRYSEHSLDIGDCSLDPLEQMTKWLQEAISCQCDEPNAFVLSTCGTDRPRGRVVLLKGLKEGKFFFYTNYKSAKGEEILENDHVAMTFLWLPLHRQVRIEGKVRKASEKDSDDYFKKRPRGSQLGAIASPQSSRVNSRAELEKWFHDAEEKYKNQEVLPRPAHWGGYTVEPDYIEFWQGRDNRMHDRIAYELKNGRWDMYRLAP